MTKRMMQHPITLSQLNCRFRAELGMYHAWCGLCCANTHHLQLLLQQCSGTHLTMSHILQCHLQFVPLCALTFRHTHPLSHPRSSLSGQPPLCGYRRCYTLLLCALNLHHTLSTAALCPCALLVLHPLATTVLCASINSLNTPFPACW